MIHIKKNQQLSYKVILIQEESEAISKLSLLVQKKFQGKALQIANETVEGQLKLYIGVGHLQAYDAIFVKELGAKTVKVMKDLGAYPFEIDCELLIKAYGKGSLKDLVEGLLLGDYESISYAKKEKEEVMEVYLSGVQQLLEFEQVEEVIREVSTLMNGVILARDWVNKPGNKLRPYQFVEEIKACLKDTPVEVKVLDKEAIEKVGMKALLAVGESSEYSPYFVVLRYLQDETSEEVLGLVGKGVTCDTGGYCLKPASSMLGIKGDMAGAAAVVGAMYSLAQNNIKANAIACLPICENRISESSLLPGDVISSLAGKTIEVLNTDAEGRLILADAVTYAVQKEKVTKVLDIATLTGAVVGLLGFSIAGVLSNEERLWGQFARAANQSGERYLRVPYYKEHEKMIKSQIADLKNMGESYCGTITAGLFIKAFTEDKPWIHLDIAGTAWVDSPVFEYQTKGATGAGVTTLYYLCQQKEANE